MIKKNIQQLETHQNPGVLIGKDQMEGYLVFVKSVVKEPKTVNKSGKAPTH